MFVPAVVTSKLAGDMIYGNYNCWMFSYIGGGNLTAPLDLLGSDLSGLKRYVEIPVGQLGSFP